MGFADAFAFKDAAAIFREHAALSAFENNGARDFDIGAYARISSAQFDALAPFQWPQRVGQAPQERRFFADGGFFTPDRRGRFIPIDLPARTNRTSPERPFTLNTGRMRDQWHTMTRTGKAARLMAHAPEPFCEIHPDDAGPLGIAHGDLVEIDSGSASGVFRAGRPPGTQEDPGPLVCSCFSVGVNSIAKAIRSGCASVAAIGELLKAGTNCGSCRSEISMMLEEQIHARPDQQTPDRQRRTLAQAV